MEPGMSDHRAKVTGTFKVPVICLQNRFIKTTLGNAIKLSVQL
jgi:hypothetical protein